MQGKLVIWQAERGGKKTQTTRGFQWKLKVLGVLLAPCVSGELRFFGHASTGNIPIARRCRLPEIAISLRAIPGGFTCPRRVKPGEINPAEAGQEVSATPGDRGSS